MIIKLIKILAVVSVIFAIVYPLTVIQPSHYPDQPTNVFLSKGIGYSGPIELSIKTDASFNIEEIKVLSHNETEPYVLNRKLSVFLEQFKGKRLDGKTIPDIDTITGATMTSRALIDIINNAGNKISKGSIDKDLSHYQPRQRLDGRGGVPYILLIFLVVSVIIWRLKKNFLRWAVLFFSIVYLGFIKKSMLALPNIVSILSGHLPNFYSNISWYLFYGFILLTPLLIGRFFCGWLCPFGALQEFVNIAKIRLLCPEHRLLRYVKYFILWFLLFIALLTRDSSLANYEPFSTTFTLQGSIYSWAYVAFIILLSIPFSRIFCKYLCAPGAFLGLLSHFGLKKLKIKEGCTSCGKCADVCPTDAIEDIPEKGGFNIDFSECIQCNKCIKVCPVDVIGKYP